MVNWRRNMLVVVGLVGLCWIIYGRMLGIFFTATDTLVLIETSRVQNMADWWSDMSQPLMAGSGFVQLFRYFRPVSVISYALDYAVWQLNSFGYQLTNLVLHTMVGVMVYLTFKLLDNGRWRYAAAAAALFILHPVMIESVPAAARRQDVLIGLFELVSVYAWARWRKKRGSKRWLAVSLVSAGLAYGSKEVAFIYPLILLGWELVFGAEGRQGWRRLQQALLTLKWHWLVWVGYLVWWYYVLEGKLKYGLAGGSGGGLVEPVVRRLLIFGQYNQALLFSYGSAVWWSRVWMAGLYLVGAALALVFLKMEMKTKGGSRAVVRQFIKSGDGWLKSRLVGRRGKIGVWCAIWVGLGYAVFLLSGNFSVRSVYGFVIPLSWLMILALSWAHGRVRKWYELGGMRRGEINLIEGVAVVGIGLFWGYWLAFSPLVIGDGGWGEVGRMSWMYLTNLSNQIYQVPAGSRLVLYGVPGQIVNKEAVRAGSLSFLVGRSIKSWLILNGLDKDYQVVVASHQDRPVMPAKIEVRKVSGAAAGEVWLEAVYD